MNMSYEDYKATGRFDIMQLLEIKLGLEKGVDVTIYAKPEFNWEQMREIFFGLVNGINVYAYADSKFTVEQMQEIFYRLVEEKGDL